MSDGTYNLDEIIGMAVQIEECGGAFYRALQKKAATPQLRDLYSFLAAEEEGHIRDFTRIRLSAVKDKGSPSATSEEALLYLTAAAGDRVFSDPAHAARVAAGFATPAEAISFAVEFERKNIDFFRHMQDSLGNPDDRMAVEQLVIAEESHVEKLERIAERLARQPR